MEGWVVEKSNARKILVAFVGAILFVGCATTKLKINNARLPYDQKEINLLIEPWESFGLRVTEAMRKSEVTVIQGVFPDILFGEWHPFPPRLKWYGWVVTEEGQEFLAQSILSGLSPSGAFVSTIVIDGKGPKLDNARIVQLSTLLEYAYDLAGNEYSLDGGKFTRDTEGYRRKFVREKGTRLGDMRKVSGFFNDIRKWTRYEKRGDKSYVLYSPLNEEKLREMAKLNPQYSFSQRLIGSGRFAVAPMDPVATVMENALDVYSAFSGKFPTTGWDYRSEMPSRRNMGVIISFVSQLRQRLIDNLNQQLLIERSGVARE